VAAVAGARGWWRLVAGKLDVGFVGARPRSWFKLVLAARNQLEKQLPNWHVTIATNY
jgi:hypothetical protein